MKSHFSSTLFALFSSVLIGFLLYVFYATELRERLESLFFDVRTTIKPQILDYSRVAVVSVDQKDIAFFGQSGSARIPVTAFIELIQAVRASKAQGVALLLPHQDFEYEDEELKPLIDFVAQTPNVFLGVFDYHQVDPSKVELPPVFKRIEGSVAGASTLRKYRQGVIREIPLMSYLGDRLVPQLVTNLALRMAFNQDKIELLSELGNEVNLYHKTLKTRRIYEEASDLPSFFINYWKPESFVTVSARDLVQEGHAGDLSGKLVLIGYTAFRPRSINHRDGTHVNTPWQGEDSAEDEGTPLVFVKATMLENLLSSSWLREGAVYLNVVQTAILTFLSFFIWRMAPSLAVVLFLLAFSVLVYVHGLLFSYAFLIVPAADTAIFSIFAAITGAFLKAQQANKKRTLREIKSHIRRELTLTQDRFLNRFAFDLYETNHKIFKILERTKDAFTTNEAASSAHWRVLSSCLELQDYLEGIRHYSLIRQGHWQSVSKSRVELLPLIQRVCNQFDQLIENRELTVAIYSSSGCAAWSNEIILEPVVFNLISNAIKYSPQKGTVDVRIEPVNRRKLAIKVSDEGVGIPSDLHEKIFEKFYRIPDDRSFRVKGNGLGLYLCRFFAERIGAKINVKSKEGKGSEFSILLERSRI
ncbi:MAG: CHASE2 domain-containing protein [Deltaproteobacteria bacterium]|nr:CHASE2 domain-containing protein [Deltaproteobacteria bacterium]